MNTHNARIGAVIHAYNSAHCAVFMVLLHAASSDSHAAARDLWFSYGSDSAQRDFVAIYCRENNLIEPPVRRAITWALNAFGKIAVHRNDAAHSDMIWHYDRLAPGLLAKDQTHKRFEERPFEDIWQKLRGDYSALSNYIMDLAYDITLRNTWPSSKRPRLLLLHSENTKRQERNRRAKQKARKLPPQS